MSGKLPVAILFIGIAGLSALGFIVQYSLDSVPELKKIGELKQAVAETVESRDLRSLSVRQDTRHDSVVFALRFAELTTEEAPALADDVANVYVHENSGRRRRNLKIVLTETGAFGWGEREVFERDYRLSALIAEKNIRVKLGNLLNREVPSMRVRIDRANFIAPEEVRIELVPISGQSGEMAVDGWNVTLFDAHYRELRRVVMSSLSGSPFRTLHLVVRSAPGAEIIEDIRIDRSAQSLPSRDGPPARTGTAAAEVPPLESPEARGADGSASP